MVGAMDPADPGAFPDLEAVLRWRRRFEAGEDPGPPPAGMPGLERLVRARRLGRHLEQHLGFDEPVPVTPLDHALAALLLSRPAAPVIASDSSALRPLPLGAATGRVLVVERHGRPVFAYRAWVVSAGRMRGVLTEWPVPTVEARCVDPVRRTGPDADDVPHVDAACGPAPCGIYAAKAADAMAATLPADGRAVVGVVALFGKVVEHERGYRAAAATAVAALVVGRDEVIPFAGVEVDELFLAPEAAAASARGRASPMPVRGEERNRALAALLEAAMAPFCGASQAE